MSIKIKPQVLAGAVLAVAGGLAVVLCSNSARASLLLDPATLHIGTGAGAPCAEGCAGDPNMIGAGSTFSVFQNSNGAETTGIPLDIILATPDYNHAGTTAPTLGTATLIDTYPGGTVTTPTISSTLTAFGLGSYSQGSEMTTGDIYSFLNSFSTTDSFSPADNSNNIANLTGELTHVGQSTAGLTGFDIYVFQVATDFAANDLLNVTGNTMSKGTFVVAYGEGTKNLYDTPFTEAGFDAPGTSVPVPEPSSLAIFGAALAGLGLVRRRRRKSA